MLREKINQSYLDNQKDRIQHRFYISDAGKCPRQIFYSFKNAPKKQIEPNFLRLFDLGNHVHQLILRSILNIKDIHVVASEINIPPQEMISGRTDAIINDGEQLYVLDIKSINNIAFNKLAGAKEDDIKQIQLYLYYFQIKKGILLYMNKDNLRLKEFMINYDSAQAEKLIENLTILKKQIDSNIIPQRLDGYPKNWRCRYCNYREICDSDGQNKK